MNLNEFFVGSGVTGGIAILAYVVKLVIEWRRVDADVDNQRTAAGFTSAETANAVILKSLEAMERENARLRARVVDLEASEAAKDAKIDELQAQVRQIMSELSALKSYS